jgi:hypothetical protein
LQKGWIKKPPHIYTPRGKIKKIPVRKGRKGKKKRRKMPDFSKGRGAAFGLDANK